MQLTIKDIQFVLEISLMNLNDKVFDDRIKWKIKFFNFIETSQHHNILSIFIVISIFCILGPLIHSITKNMIAVQNLNPPNTKIYLYSGHETNIASLLHAFNVYKPHVPEYSSAIILELYLFGKEHYVKVRHNVIYM